VYKGRKQVYRVLTEMGYAKYGQRLCRDDVRRTLWFRADRLPEGLTPLEVFNAKISANDA